MSWAWLVYVLDWAGLGHWLVPLAGLGLAVVAGSLAGLGWAKA